ncbi:MAG: TonB-dependent receptor, partial [Pseudomonadales bacterium]
MLTRTRKPGAIACFCAGILGAVGASAQEQLLLEEVVVTAQKRAESLSDVPISVNVMSGEKIAQAGITNLNDLSDFVPNLTMNQTGIGTNIAIRGISSGINPAFEQSVGMYIDDIYYGRSQLARVPYLDPDRVEILRGPQPILFGKNAIAGAISMATKRTSLEGLEGFVQAEYNFDQETKDLQFGVNIPMGETVAGRIAGLYRDTEGYYENSTLSRDESANEEWVIRGSFMFEPTDELSLLLKLETGEFDTEGRFLELVNPVEVGGSPSFADALFGSTGGAVVLDTKQDFKRQSNGDIEENEFQNATLTIDYA